MGSLKIEADRPVKRNVLTAPSEVQKFSSPTGSQRSHSEVSVPDGAEGGASEAVQAVDQDQRARQVLPPFGDGVPHPVKAHVKLLDDVAVAVANVGGPGQEEVVGWFPHALRTEVSRERRNGSSQDSRGWVLYGPSWLF